MPPRKSGFAEAPQKNLRSARGTSMGGARHAPSERAAVGLNPVPGLDVDLEDVGSLPANAVTATVEALSRLIERGGRSSAKRPGCRTGRRGRKSPRAASAST